MQRYFVDKTQITQDQIRLTGADHHHIKNVMRSKFGDELICCDGQGNDYLVCIEEISSQVISCRILKQTPSLGEPNRQVTIAQALPKGDKIEWVFQKGTEIGATNFLPFTSERTIVKIAEKKEEKKRRRWQKIVKEAAEQAGRGKIPTVAAIHSWQQLLSLFPSFDLVWIAYEGGGDSIADQIARTHAKSVLVIIGPEGGFTQREVGEAMEKGAIPITLGPRILRTETASLVVLASIFSVGGELI